MATAQTKTKATAEYLALKRSEPLLIEQAQLGIQLAQEISELSAQAEDIKAWFRDYADGEKFDLTVPGVGSVQVKTPAPPTSGESIKFDEAAFNLLPMATRKLLIDRGVVSVETWSRSGSKAAVSFTPNK